LPGSYPNYLIAVFIRRRRWPDRHCRLAGVDALPALPPWLSERRKA
jgi:hypothetical protein